MNKWKLIETTFSSVCESYRNGKFVPLLEADFVGYVYYLLVNMMNGDSSFFHLDARVRGVDGKEKFDLVIGKVISTEERKKYLLEKHSEEMDESLKKIFASKSAVSILRPAIEAELILEFKIFSIGFDSAQLSEHFRQVEKDAKKLHALNKICPEGRGLVLFDDQEYLTQGRKGRLLNGDTNDIRIYLFQKNIEGDFSWERLQ